MACLGVNDLALKQLALEVNHGRVRFVLGNVPTCACRRGKGGGVSMVSRRSNGREVRESSSLLFLKRAQVSLLSSSPLLLTMQRDPRDVVALHETPKPAMGGAEMLVLLVAVVDERLSKDLCAHGNE